MTAEPSMEIAYVRADGTLTYDGLALLQDLAAVSGGTASWGTITGTLSSQTDLNTALSGKAATVHTHTASQVTDFSEAVDDRVAVLAVAGANMTITYNDGANTLTFASTGGAFDYGKAIAMATTAYVL